MMKKNGILLTGKMMLIMAIGASSGFGAVPALEKLALLTVWQQTGGANWINTDPCEDNWQR